MQKGNYLSHKNYYFVLLYRLVLAYLLFFVARWIFYYFNGFLFPNVDRQEVLSILAGGARFDLAGFLYINLLFIILSLLPIPSRSGQGYQRFLKSIFLTTNALAFLMNCADIVYYKFTLRRTTYGVFNEFKNESAPAKFAFQFLADYWYIGAIFIVITWVFTWLYNRLRVTPERPNGLVFYGGNIALLLISIYLAIGGIRGGFLHSTRPLAMTDAGQYVSIPSNMNLVLNTPFTFIRTFGKSALKEVSYFNEEELEPIYSPLFNATNHNNKDFKEKNVVIIILESFGKENVGFYNKALENGTYTGYTPFLDSLLGEGYVVWNSFANGHKSIDALPSVLASIPSGPQPFVLTSYTSNQLKALPYLLREEGYHTSFFHGAPNGSMGFNAFTKLAGIDHYYGKNEFNNDTEFDGMWGIWDEPFFQYFGEQLKTFPKPFMSTIFSLSSHHPFRIPAQYEGVFKKGALPVQECIGYSDMALRKFFESIKDTDWFNNTLFVITADHATTRTQPEYVTEWGDMSIPILFYDPGNKALQKVDKKSVVQQMDIMPTVLNYLNYSKPYLAFGENILSDNHWNFAYNYQSGHRWVEGEYLLFFDGEKSTGLYNYVTDVYMKKNLLTQEPERAMEMEKKVKAFVQQYNKRLIHNQLVFEK